MLVYVVDQNGQLLMPTTRGAFVRIALKEGRAKFIRTKPFTIQLLYETTSFTQPFSGGTDPGRTNIGEAVLDAGGEVLYNAHITTRNEEIPDLMAERKAHRQASRRGERKVRQRRAIKNGTITFPLEKERTPRGCEKPIVNKYIRNSEARFVNRKRPANWLTPTTNQLVETHLNAVKDICRLLPVSDWILEINRFAFMRMEDGSIRGADFQNGRLKGYPSVNAYIFALQGGCCACCGKPLIEHYHHIVPRHLGGSDGPENIAGLCNECHGKVHSKSTRYYNSEGRCMPGTVFYYKGRRYVLSGQHSYGAYFRAVGCGKKNFPARDCRLVGSGGLVYI